MQLCGARVVINCTIKQFFHFIGFTESFYFLIGWQGLSKYQYAGYSITQYTRLEEGSRFLEFEDFMRIGVVFYMYQESLSPDYIQAWNRVVLFLRSTGFQFRCYLERMRKLFES